MEKLERYKWTSNNPDTYITPSYTYRRSGADMIYSIALLVEKPTGTFGFPIYLDLALDGVTKVSEYTIKAASPSSWTSYTYQSAEFTVKRKSSGSTSLKIRIYSGSGSSRDQTNYFNLFVSPAESKLTIDPNFKIGSPFTLSITKYDTSFIDSIELQLNNTTVLTRSPVFHGTVITPTKAETAKMYAQCPNSNHASAKLTLRTKDASGNSIGQSIRTGTAQVTNSNPTQAKFVVADINPKTLVLTGDNQKSIKGYSDLLVTITQAALAQNSASLKNYLVSCGTKQVVITPPQTAATITAAGAGNITVTAMDSRGNQTSSTMSLDMIAYQPVHITTAQAVRDNIADALTKLSYQGSYFSGSFGSIDNTIIKAQYSYKLTSADSYTDISNVDVMPVLDSEGKFHFGPEYIYGDLLANGFTAMSSFDIKLELSDRLTTVVYQVQLPAGVPGLFLKRTGNDYALGVGMIPTVKKGLQVDGSLVLPAGVMADYVTQEGTNDGWYYRIWASKKIEFWKYFRVENINMGANNYSGFRYSDEITVYLPSAFKLGTIPYVTCHGGSNSLISFVRNVSNGTVVNGRGQFYFWLCGHMDAITYANVSAYVMAELA